ncbi:MAG TPA: hypothetical protein VH879_06055 [Gemmatimonadales bacterium]|jgi:hypothetical protein
MRTRWLALLSLALLACSSSTKASTGRTERETDSVIANSQVPGASAVKQALNAADSESGRIAKQDSIAAAP